MFSSERSHQRSRKLKTDSYYFFVKKKRIDKSQKITCSMAGAVQFCLLGLQVGWAPLLGVVDEVDGVDVDSASLEDKASSRIIISSNENRRD